MKRVRDDFSQFQKKTDDDFRLQNAALNQERQAREIADHEIQEKLKAKETGGLHISAMGAIWLIAGAILATIPSELARWLP